MFYFKYCSGIMSPSSLINPFSVKAHHWYCITKIFRIICIYFLIALVIKPLLFSFRERVEVANVEDIQEKVFYMDGNRQNACIARAPNFVERE